MTDPGSLDATAMMVAICGGDRVGVTLSGLEALLEHSNAFVHLEMVLMLLRCSMNSVHSNTTK